MSKKSFAFGLCFLLICSAFIPIAIGFNVKVLKVGQSSTLGSGKTLYVGGSGPDNYTKIKDAIFDAVSGDTVFVYDDSAPYYERFGITKSINLIGENKETVVIDGEGIGGVVNIVANNVVFSGFTIINCGISGEDWSWMAIRVGRVNNVIIKDNIISPGKSQNKHKVAGIYLKSSYSLIQDNIIFGIYGECNISGITFDGGSIFNNISGNEIYGCVWGIYNIFSTNYMFFNNYIHDNDNGIYHGGRDNQFIKNIISKNKHTGIYSDYVEHTIFLGNTITYNGQGGSDDYGIRITGAPCSYNNQILNNQISYNTPIGLVIGVDSSIISYNQISNNIIGIYCVGDFNQIIDNNISNNGEIGLSFYSAFNNTISGNNFINNDKNANFVTFFWRFFGVSNFLKKNKWNNNYWSDYSSGKFYIIWGTVYFPILYCIQNFLSFPWLQIDWHPAKEPYDIEGVV